MDPFKVVRDHLPLIILHFNHGRKSITFVDWGGGLPFNFLFYVLFQM